MTPEPTTPIVGAPLPPGWRWARLGDVCQFLDHLRIPVRDSDRQARTAGKTVDQLYPYLGANGQAGWIDDYLFDEELVLLAEDGGFFGSTDTPIAYRVSGKCWVNNHAHVLRPGPDVDVEWLHFTLRLRPDVLQFVSGTTRPKLNQDGARQIPIPLPLLPEQRRIAAILRDQLDAVRRARAAALARLEAARALPAAFLRAVFDSEEAKQWPKRPFGEIAMLQRGHDLPSYMQTPGPYPVMTSSGQMGTHAEFKIQGPGVVTGRSGSIGKVYYVEHDYWPHNTALYVKDFKGNHPRYVFFLLQWLNLETLHSGVGVPTLDRKSVHRVEAPLPDPRMQEALSFRLYETSRLIEPVVVHAQQQLAAIDSLPQTLLRRAFAGDL